MLNYKDRSETAERLSERLARLHWQQPAVLAIPRGAVPMAATIAKNLSASLDVVLVHKLRAPGNPEYAIGAVDESGQVIMDPSYGRLRHTPVIEQEIEHEYAVLKARRHRYGGQPPLLQGRDVIIVDDGAATGATIKAAIQSIRGQQPNKIVVALGVASPETVGALKRLADCVICPCQPQDFVAVSQAYQAFPQISDAEVEAILRRDAEEHETSACEYPIPQR